MRLVGGWLHVGSYRGAPVRIHWSTPIGAFVLTGLAFVPGAWVGFLLLVLVHELGHAVLVRRFRLSVLSVDVHGLGGVCRWSGSATDRQRAIIAWGGVLGQAVLLAAALLAAPLVGASSSPFVRELRESLIATNLTLMAINLLPVPPLDGAAAWSLFRWRRSQPAPQTSPRRRDFAAEASKAAPRPAPRQARPPIEKELEELERIDRADPRDSPEVRRLLEEIARRQGSGKRTLN